MSRPHPGPPYPQAGPADGAPVPAGSAAGHGPPVQPEPTGPGTVPTQLRWAGGLLLLNLVLSISVTVVSFLNRDDMVAMMVSASGGSMDDAGAETFAERMLLLRAGGNLLVAVTYGFLMWGAWQGKRWAWRRLLWLAFAGAIAIGYLLTQPYTPVLKVQQGVQIGVLLALGAVLLHPAVRAHCAKCRR
ncbi:hypothetical protein [Actinophytocola gossypii]|uniref:DUF2127 domain-containing protein n=1 Tax=Actinophytocola gossypii TaxID=2812003 RepID=A0ABT2J7E5_9PSEU|nr:hypothetical protein [Actinophytocola gossypii]MCT2583778.1 hypothetical protein [Actinophytocola gossypii]